MLWTISLGTFDVQEIGPNNTEVGLGSVNGFVHNLTGVNMTLYNITDWLGLVPVAFGFGFAVLGLVQWIKRKSFVKVDFSLLVLGGFYIVLLGVYLLFEEIVINYRPVLIEGFLEVSYPSSTTLLVMTVMPTALTQMKNRIKNKNIRAGVCILIAAFTVFMVVGRLLCGVHWLTDIIGGALLSAGLVKLYGAVVGKEH